MYVHGKNVITDITVNDGEWHFICTTWTSLSGQYNIYIDGILRDSGSGLSPNLSIEANGTIIVGQEQVLDKRCFCFKISIKIISHA